MFVGKLGAEREAFTFFRSSAATAEERRARELYDYIRTCVIVFQGRIFSKILAIERDTHSPTLSGRLVRSRLSLSPPVCRT